MHVITCDGRTWLKNLIFTLMLFCITACAPTVVLKNGFTKVPARPDFFKNKIYFDQSVLSKIDTDVIYEQFDDNYYTNYTKQEDTLARLNDKSVYHGYTVYRFYSNGCFNAFYLRKDKPELEKDMFDPDLSGWRGVLYKKKNRILGDTFTQLSGVRWVLGIKTQEFRFSGDTLYVYFDKIHKHTYLKRVIDTHLLKHEANW